MPRIDNQSLDVAQYYGFDHIPIDQYARPTVDLCRACAAEWEIEDRDDEIDHPDYEEQHPRYRCLDCGEELTEEDN